MSAEVQAEFDRLRDLLNVRPEAGDLLAILAHAWVTWRKATAVDITKTLKQFRAV
jgi:hypothetical protein